MTPVDKPIMLACDENGFGCNNKIKEERTFRERLPMGQFVEAMEGLCTDSSTKDDTHLFGNR